MTRRTENPWTAAWLAAARLATEAPGVIALRMVRLSAGGAAGRAEARRMVMEKTSALLEAQRLSVAATLRGEPPPEVAAKVLRGYLKKVRGNRRRLRNR